MAEPAWRPIESAPKDQDIIVFSQRWGSLIAEFSSEFGQWFPRMQCPVALHGEDDGLTHWMPLPVAPEACRSASVRGLRFASQLRESFELAPA
ncbi:MAG: hypothetical protein K0S06_2150 [Microvirga sp.]|jgi:hypothetical protein|nr:hypothetical protein [Microvirga sp.]